MENFVTGVGGMDMWTKNMKPPSQLLECPDCKGVVSSRAQFCPHCGCPIRYIIEANIEKKKRMQGYMEQAEYEKELFRRR